MKKRTPPGADSVHDKSYASLFTHPRLVKDLLRGFLPADWVQQLDFRTLEKANPIYISPYATVSKLSVSGMSVANSRNVLA